MRYIGRASSVGFVERQQRGLEWRATMFDPLSSLSSLFGTWVNPRLWHDSDTVVRLGCHGEQLVISSMMAACQRVPASIIPVGTHGSFQAHALRLPEIELACAWDTPYLVLTLGRKFICQMSHEIYTAQDGKSLLSHS